MNLIKIKIKIKIKIRITSTIKKASGDLNPNLSLNLTRLPMP